MPPAIRPATPADAATVVEFNRLLALETEGKTLDRVRTLMSHPAFSATNPNRVRALIGSFAQANQREFNRADGAGYDFTADFILKLDGSNPQVASRLTTAFRSWRCRWR